MFVTGVRFTFLAVCEDHPCIISHFLFTFHKIAIFLGSMQLWWIVINSEIKLRSSLSFEAADENCERIFWRKVVGSAEGKRSVEVGSDILVKWRPAVGKIPVPDWVYLGPFWRDDVFETDTWRPERRNDLKLHTGCNFAGGKLQDVVLHFLTSISCGIRSTNIVNQMAGALVN